MNTRLLIILSCILCLGFTAACSKSETSDATSDVYDMSSYDVGLNTGNPTTNPTKQTQSLTLSFSTSSQSESAEEEQSWQDYCKDLPKITKFKNVLSHACSFTPQSLVIGVTSMSLAYCPNEAGENDVCANATEVSEGANLYTADSGEVLRIDMSEGIADVSEKISALSGSVESGGMNLSIAYVELKSPGNDDAHGYRVASGLQNVTYKICTTNHKDVDVTNICGEGAKLGDVYFDVDGDGEFAKLDESYQETMSDEIDVYNIKRYLKGIYQLANLSSDGSATLELFAAGDIYLESVLSFDQVVSFSEDESKVINISYDLSNTFIFMDGLLARDSQGDGSKSHVCLDELVDGDCQFGSSDPNGIGIFDTNYDQFVQILPAATVEVE